MKNRRIAALICQAAIALVSLASAVQADIPAEINSGREVARRLCVGCHVMDGRPNVTIEGVAVPSFLDVATRPNRSAERLAAYLAIPHRPMPAMPLQTWEIRDLVSYIQSLK